MGAGCTLCVTVCASSFYVWLLPKIIKCVNREISGLIVRARAVNKLHLCVGPTLGQEGFWVGKNRSNAALLRRFRAHSRLSNASSMEWKH